MAAMSGGAPPTIQIPRWIQLVGLPILALIALLVVGKVVHAVFLFLVAALIALLLDPLVRALGKLRIPRGLSIAIVYLSFAAALAVVFIAIGVIVVDQTQSAANRVDAYLTSESVAVTLMQNVSVLATGKITGTTNVNLIPESQREYSNVSLMVLPMPV